VFTDFIPHVQDHVHTSCISGYEIRFYSPVTYVRWTNLFLAAK